jgi:hypothetical protein
MLKIHETNGRENIFKNGIIIESNNPHKNSLVTNVNEVEQYDLTYENCIQTKIYNNKNETLKFSLLKMK